MPLNSPKASAHGLDANMRDSSGVCDVLMIAHKRPEYLNLALPALLDSGDKTLRVWVWQNGEDEAVTKIIDAYLKHDRLYKVHRSSQNAKLTEPTNWIWSQSDAPYVGKVDDDTLVSKGWLDSLRSAHQKFRRFGVLGSWIYALSDYDEKAARRKVSRYGGQAIVENPWMAGSAYLMKRACVQEVGLLQAEDTFPAYCVRLAWLDWIHGWPLPLMFAEHMDDPRSPRCILKTQEDFEQSKPLTATKNNIHTLEEWKEFNRNAIMPMLRSPKKAGRLFWIRSRVWRAIRKSCSSK